MELNELNVPIKDLATTAAMTVPTSLPPAPPPIFSSLPTEIIAMIAKELLLDAKGPEGPSKDETSIRWKKERKAMGEAITGLASLAHTSRRLNKIVTPVLYEHPFLLQQNRFDSTCNIEHLYGLVHLLGKDDGLADLVRCYQAPKIAISDTLGAFLDRCYREPKSYQKVLTLLNKYIPFLANIVAGRGHLDNGYLEAPGVMADLIPAVILCHCRSIKQLDRLSIGGNRGGNCWRFLWRDVVAAGSSVTFPNLQSAKLESFTELHLLPITNMAALRRTLTAVDEAVSFVNHAAPSLRHLTLKSFASCSSWDGGPSTVPDQIPIRTLEKLTSLEMHYCAFLKETDLCRIIKACPKLERFVFTSEASPRGGGRFTGLKSAFIGPKMALKALAPVSQQLKALSIKYAALVDLSFMDVLDDDDTDMDMEDDDMDITDDDADMLNDTDTDYDDEMDMDLDIDEDGPMDPNENLIKTLGHFQQFLNLKILRISHSALHRCRTPSSSSDSGPDLEEKDQQLVDLIKGCPSLESLDVTQYDIQNTPIRPQLEGLIAAVASTTPLSQSSQLSQLKSIRISLDTSSRRLEADWINDNSDNPYLKDQFARQHLTKYIQRGMKLRIDVAPLKEYEVLEPFPGPGSATTGQNRGGVSFAPCLERFLPPAPPPVARKKNKKVGKGKGGE
ncbi:hypothetical protein SMACR_09516 [Sordaria macrospora]|uniref:F-box domain-containing protein n=1 Tax=Sordaria macrospora TaxID=5147 RepID=A0A8S9A8J1_SORMA|nr:hypothetical protein SMACR_09516 [Sordaria macrospora]